MINKNELVSILKSQHRELQSNLGESVSMIKEDKVEECLGALIKFKLALTEHLELENGTFYPDYLQTKDENIQSKIKKFIDEMVLIGTEVMNFLKKYDNVEKISQAKDIFSLELNKIISVLNLRIEIEEQGLYDVYAIS